METRAKILFNNDSNRNKETSSRRLKDRASENIHLSGTREKNKLVYFAKIKLLQYHNQLRLCLGLDLNIHLGHYSSIMGD